MIQDVWEIIALYTRISTIQKVCDIDVRYVASRKIQMRWRHHSNKIIGRRIRFASESGQIRKGIIVAFESSYIKVQECTTMPNNHSFFIDCEFVKDI